MLNSLIKFFESLNSNEFLYQLVGTKSGALDLYKRHMKTDAGDQY